MKRVKKLNPGKPLGISLSLEEIRRLFSKITEDPATGCWLWEGYCDENGYGQVKLHGQARGVHRVVYGILKSRKIGGHEIDHDRKKCSHKNCCNPAHLRRMTHSQNSTEASHYRHRKEEAGDAPF